MAEPPPPSYDDVLAAGSSPIVPMSVPPTSPSSVTPSRPPAASSSRPPTTANEQQRRGGGRAQGVAGSAERHRTSAPRSSMPQSGGRSSQAIQRQQQHKEPPRGFGEKLARFSMPSLMLAGIATQEELDPDLDHEAHLPGGISRDRARQRKRLQCLCACLWCVGFSLLFCFVALPVGMIMAGIFGMESCPYMNNLVIIYLYVGGSLLAVSVALRLCSSTFTCCKLTDVWNLGKSSGCSCVIWMTEGLFAISVILNLVMVAAGGYLVLRERPQAEPTATTGDENYCDPGIYLAAMIFIGLAAVLALCLVVVLMLAGCCYTVHKDLYKPPEGSRVPPSQARRSPGRNTQWTATSF